ncbi:MAG TPA: SRPBCC family protein [Actinomycetota bacterium]|nr:SRPBCC family protein [Actinomycetota bacterium]
MKVSSEVVLPAPVERAWDLLLRWEDQPRWMRDADSVRVVGSQREGVGTTIAVRTRVLNVPLFTERLEVTIWDPPRRLVMAHRSFVRGVGTWRLQPIEGGTWFSWVEDLWLPVPVLGELALRAYRPFMRRLMAGALAALRDRSTDV